MYGIYNSRVLKYCENTRFLFVTGDIRDINTLRIDRPFVLPENEIKYIYDFQPIMFGLYCVESGDWEFCTRDVHEALTNCARMFDRYHKVRLIGFTIGLTPASYEIREHTLVDTEIEVDDE